ncbi:MAG: type II toxin-antitoxin system VapC family toxin [Stackebrandtia sp.]
MKLLLDTHVVLWWLTGSEELPESVKHTIDTDPHVYLSSAVLWEVAIKQATGKLEGPSDLCEQIAASGLTELPVRFAHAIEAGRLPEIHRDPFDRMLVAQAQCENLTLVTRDKKIPGYDVVVMSV